jgi:hypothetical protein
MGRRQGGGGPCCSVCSLCRACLCLQHAWTMGRQPQAAACHACCVYGQDKAHAVLLDGCSVQCLHEVTK